MDIDKASEGEAVTETPATPQRESAVDLRIYIEKIIDERHLLYTAQFKAAETAVVAALAAQDKATQAGFLASEKAVLKAEVAQKDYNDRSNEFRGQLDDQAKTLMPRQEVQTIVKSLEEKLESSRATSSKDIDVLRTDIRGLRESRSEIVGKDIAVIGAKQESHWNSDKIFSFLMFLIAMVALFLRLKP